jgi:NADPH:quinone reductase-like Zn-dependent oxidoreductase
LLVAVKRATITDFVLNGLADGTLKPVIDKTFPLEHIVEAHR